MFSASKFSAHLGQPRAVCSSAFPQSRQVFVLIAFGLQLKHVMHYSTGPARLDSLDKVFGTSQGDVRKD
jgi:hypothetical protein